MILGIRKRAHEENLKVDQHFRVNRGKKFELGLYLEKRSTKMENMYIFLRVSQNLVKIASVH